MYIWIILSDAPNNYVFSGTIRLIGAFVCDAHSASNHVTNNLRGVSNIISYWAKNLSSSLQKNSFSQTIFNECVRMRRLAL